MAKGELANWKALLHNCVRVGGDCMTVFIMKSPGFDLLG